MTDHRVEKPYERERKVTTELVGTKPARGVSERSGVRLPPVLATPEDEAEAEPPKWAKALLERVDKSEGRFLAELAEQGKRMRNEAVVPAEQKRERAEEMVREAEAKSQQTSIAAKKIEKRWKGVATGLGGLAGLALATCTGALVNGLSTNKQVVEVASDVAETKAAELERAHEQTREIAIRNTARLDKMESALEEILTELRALKPEEHTTVVVPKPKRAK